MVIVLETERLVVRRFTEDDAEELLRLESDPEVLKHVGRGPLTDAAAYRRHIRSAFLPWYDCPGTHGVWAVVERASREFIGACSLKPALRARYAAVVGYAADDVELGYGLRRASWGKGYATELARALVQRGFLDPDAARVVASVSVENVASIRVLEKAGLQRDNGLFLLPGEDQPSRKYALGRDLHG
jgi:RimJ/RimL family protein N-acetyltransferase